MTTALSNLGIGLSLVFGCLFLALFAEIYYVLWWKKRFHLHNTDDQLDQQAEIPTTSPRDQLLYLFCLRRPSSSMSSTAAVNPHEISRSMINGFHDPENQIHDLQLQSSSGNKELFLKPFGDGYGLESEIMGLHQVAGPPRFLFTIKEETKEDMESEEGRSRSCGGRSSSKGGSRNRSLGDLLFAHVDTPFSTPLSSPHEFFTPPLTPMDYYQNNPNLALAHGFNPLFESYDAATMFKGRSSSPPPKFKFLRDAEEKLNRRIMMEAQKMHKNGGFVSDHHKKEEDGSFITIIINNRNGGDQNQQPVSVSGTATQVLPNPIHSPLTNSSSRSCSNNNQGCI